MTMLKRVQYLENLLNVDDDAGAEAILIFPEDASLDDTEPMPVTAFTFQGQEIHREPDEQYPVFETRALKTAFELLPNRQPGQPARVPVLHANGSLQT